MSDIHDWINRKVCEYSCIPNQGGEHHTDCPAHPSPPEPTPDDKRIEELATELGRAENEAKRVYGAEIDKLEEQLTAAQDLLTGDGRKLMQMLGTAQAERDELQSKIDETIDIHVIGRLRAQAEALAGAITGCVTELEDVLHNTNKGQVHFDGDDFHERLGAARKALAEYRSDK